jgi:nucleotide-binding universal stress UspA family protein
VTTTAEDRVPTIVVGVDDSDAGRRALRWAIAEAALRGDRVVALLAWEPVLTDAPLRGAYYRPEVGDEVARAVVADAVADVDPDGRAPIEVRCVEDVAARALAEASRDADLVVVGSHERNALGRLLFGSVSTKLLHHARGPVVVVPGDRL